MPRPRKTEQPYKAQANIDLLMGESQPSTTPLSIPIDSISLPETQPRRYFDRAKMEQLIQSVKTHGILENLLIRPLPGQESKYELVAGERRYRAAQAAGLKEVPVAIRELSSEQAWQIALIENLQREDLNPIEETEGILQLLAMRLNLSPTEVSSLIYKMQHEARGTIAKNILSNEQGQTVSQVLEELGRISWESFATSRLPLLKMPTDIIDAIRRGNIAYTKAQLIARVKDTEQRQALLEEAIASDLSINELKERIKSLQPATDVESPKANIQVLTRRLTQSKIWEDKKKWRQAQTLLKKLEALVTEEPFSNKTEPIATNNEE